MFKTAIASVLMVGLVLAITGCHGAYMYNEETSLDRNWGRSYETAKYNQILDPDAGQNLEPVKGLDGVGADASVDKYQQSFKKEQKQETINILKLQ